MRWDGMSRGRLVAWSAAFALGPVTLFLMEIAFRYPAHIERIYGEWLYPRIASVLGAVNGLFPFSLAQLAGVLLIVGGVIYLVRRKRRSGSKLAAVGRAFATVWALAGIIAFSFVVSWGLNYARPTLEARLELSTQDIEPGEVLDAAKRCAILATELHTSLEQPVDEPTVSPLGFARLNELIGLRLTDLRLPGDRIEPPTSPAKKLWGSSAMAYLGLSGIFIAFTGEPSINSMVPDASLPIVVAHERAHQRGIANEGEANLVAFMACSGASNSAYLSYSAYLYAAGRLLEAASQQSREEAKSAWAALGPGPRRDLVAIQEFWDRYHGPVAEAADKVNDAYLRSFRVPGGVHSYRRVVQLLIALDRDGKL